ncbi:MAG TPA: hypothetical protein VHN79_01995 [Lacunisphaera sp.]|nr:hypothetical protein [Lacunisphaera sp.]
MGVRFDPGVWDQHWHVIFNELAPIPILLVAGVVALCFARAHWWQIGLLVGFFFAVQLVFPILYAWHEYYYVAIAMLLMAAIGLAVCGLFESRVPRWAAWLVVVGLLLGQARAYYTRYYSPQREWSPGGSQLTVALKRVTEPDDVLVIAGDDWSSIIPYYSQRRALMIRRDLETTWEVIEPAFAALRGEPVAALILYGKQRENQALLDRAVRQFQLDPRPAFKWQEADVFLRRPSWSRDLDLLVGTPGIVLSAEYNPEAAVKQGREVDMTGWRPRHMTDFSMMSRWPWKYYSSYGLNRAQYKGRDYVSIHPDTRFWFKVPAGAHRLSVAIDFVADAYSEALVWPERSDGVEIVVTTQTAGAPGRVVGRRLVDPRANPGDRDRLVVDFDFVAEAAADLEFAVLPGPAGSYTRDWVLLETLTLE